MPPKEETTQTTIDGETITQIAELSAVPEVDAVDVIRNAWPEYEDEIIHSVATPRQWHLYKHGRPRVRKKWRNQLLKKAIKAQKGGGKN